MKNNFIIHTEASPGWGGQEIRILAECLWFREQGYRVELICTENSGISTAATQHGFTVHHRSLTKKTQLADFKFCHLFFKKQTPLMVGTHSNIDSRVCLAAATLAGVPHRFRYRHVSIPVAAAPWNHLIYRKFATRIITTGECISAPLRKSFHLPPDRVHTIPTGVDPPPSMPTREQSRLDLCTALQLPPHSRFLGQVSVLRRWKGHSTIMQAFDLIHRDFPDYHLVFVGGGPGSIATPEEASHHSCASNIHFTGHQENPWPYFRAFDLSILASTEGEGIPQSGMQAMLAGSPFIGTTVGGIPEIITHGETGILFPPSDPTALSQVLRSLLSDTEARTRLATNATRWATTHTPTAIMGEKIRHLITT